MADLNSYEYMLQHKRVYRARGKASTHQCVRCPDSAHDWARIHTETGDDPWTDYVPLCRSCHIRYDHIYEKVATSNRNRHDKPFPEAHRRAISHAKIGNQPSPQTRTALRAALLGRPRPPKTGDAAANEIRLRYAGGAETQAMLAREFGVSQTTIGRIINGRRSSA